MEYEDILLCIKNNNAEQLLEILKSSYTISLDDGGQPIALKVTIEDITTLKNSLDFGSKEKNRTLLRECFRCLRNCTVLNEDIQNLIVEKSVLEVTKSILKDLLDVRGDDVNCLKMLILFLTNLVVNNSRSATAVWRIFSKDLLRLLQENTLVSHNLALIYNIMCKNENIHLTQPFVEEILSLIQADNECEYLTFLLDNLIGKDHIKDNYKYLQTEHRLIILEELKQFSVKNNNDVISKEFLCILLNDFKRKSDCILKTVTDYLEQIEPREVSLLLEIIASVSSSEKFLVILQSDKSFLYNCAFLLKSIHSAGKEGENNFTAIKKLSEMKLADDTISQHPAFGFKAVLIRVLGNLVWKCKDNQDELRDLDCVALLLDCCNMDARNPLIIQWVVFAVRNLCEKNQANQDVIAALNKQGVVDSATLNELGLTLHNDGNSEIRIAPLVLNKR